MLPFLVRPEVGIGSFGSARFEGNGGLLIPLLSPLLAKEAEWLNGGEGGG